MTQGRAKNHWMTETPVTDSANTPLMDEVDQAAAGLDSLLASVLSGEEEQLKKRGRNKKGACDGHGISLGMLNIGLKKKQWLVSRS